MDVITTLGEGPLAAARLGISVDTLKTQLRAARTKLGTANTLLAAVKWSNHRRTQGPTTFVQSAPEPEPMLERDVVKYLAERAEQRGVLRRALEWRGRNDAPDQVLMFPDDYTGVAVGPGATVWVECKATGESPRPNQAREHNKMRAAGQRVEVVDSRESVDELFL